MQHPSLQFLGLVDAGGDVVTGVCEVDGPAAVHDGSEPQVLTDHLNLQEQIYEKGVSNYLVPTNVHIPQVSKTETNYKTQVLILMVL